MIRSTKGCHSFSPRKKEKKKAKWNDEQKQAQRQKIQTRQRMENLSRWVRQSIEEVGPNKEEVIALVEQELLLRGIPSDQRQAYLDVLPGVAKAVLSDPKYKIQKSERDPIAAMLQKMCS